MKYAVGIDIGGTNTRVALVDENYHVWERVQFATDVVDPFVTIAKIDEVVKAFSGRICGIGVSCPGILDVEHGTIVKASNFKEQWQNFKICKELETVTGLPVYLENDANLAGLAEAVVGEGKNHRIVQFLTISTGLGAGQVIDQKIVNGAHGFAQEVSLACMWEKGPSHGGLLPGCIECISSGTAITHRAKEAGLDVKHAGEVNDLAVQGNAVAQEIMRDAKVYLANFIATIVALSDPGIIILGGSVALKIDGFVEEVETLVKERVFQPVAPFVKVVKSTLNEDSGLLGAASLAFLKTEK